MSDFQQKHSGRVRVLVEDGRKGGATEVPFTWEQSLDEVDVYIPSPSPDPVTKKTVPLFNVKGGLLNMRVVMGPGLVAVFEAALGGRADGSECFWTTDDDGHTLHLVISKAVKGEPWPTLFRDELPAAETPEQKKQQPLQTSDLDVARKEMLLQRFQEEHPGFDFTDAQISGHVPDDPMNFLQDPSS